MHTPNPLFIVGNKRSGSSLMVNLLNLHPNVLVSHEADIAWLLFQISREPSGPMNGYPLDDDKGLQATLEIHGEIFDSLRAGSSIKEEALKNAFYEFYRRVNTYGREEWDHAANKQSLRWVGDKKPVQHADPAIWSFLDGLFSEARYLHLIRDPRYVVASMREAADEWSRTSVPEHWYGTDDSIFHDWVQNEEQVLQIKQKAPDRMHTVRLEDLAADPGNEMREVMNFLNLSLSAQMEETIAATVWKHPNRRHDPVALPEGSEQVDRILDKYGYRQPRSSAERLQ